MLEIVYLSIAIVTGYQAQVLLRRGGPGVRPYALLLLADAALAALAYLGMKADEPGRLVELVGAVSCFGFAGLVLVPPVLRDLTRRALARERLDLASWLTRVRELLSPGLGARGERELIDIIRALRGGDVEGAIAAVRTRRAAAEDPRERAALDDRLVFMLLSSSRYEEAAREYERARDAGGPVSVALAVEMVRAYGEIGDLERAAEIVTWVASLPGVAESALAYFLARARLLLLAYAGQVGSVEAAFAARRGPLTSMPVAARTYWLGTARHFAGDAEGARPVLERAVALSANDSRGRALAAERLAAPAATPIVPEPELAAQLHDAAVGVTLPLSSMTPASGGARATTLLIAANLVVHLVVTWLLGTTEATWVLARAGANVKAAAFAEPWRLLTSTFLHAGILHLLMNMLGLWILGRLVEPGLGWLRFCIVYALAGIGGSLASALFGGPGISTGASGAILGLLGAAIVDLAIVRRRSAAPSYRRALLGNLVFITIVQLGIGALYPMIDQWAHVGGLIVGGLATLAVSPGWEAGRSRAASVTVSVLLGLLVAAFISSAVLVARTSYGDTLVHVGWQRQTLGPLSLELPRTFGDVHESTASEPAWMLTPSITAEVRRRAEAGAVVKVVMDELAAGDNVAGVSEVAPTVTAPPGWHAAELRFTYDDHTTKWPFRRMILTRVDGEQLIVVGLCVPEPRASDAAAIVPRLLDSLRVEPVQ